jgi:hypothetical protein
VDARTPLVTIRPRRRSEMALVAADSLARTGLKGDPDVLDSVSMDIGFWLGIGLFTFFSAVMLGYAV